MKPIDNIDKQLCLLQNIIKDHIDYLTKISNYDLNWCILYSVGSCVKQ